MKQLFATLALIFAIEINISIFVLLKIIQEKTVKISECLRRTAKDYKFSSTNSISHKPLYGKDCKYGTLVV